MSTGSASSRLQPGSTGAWLLALPLLCGLLLPLAAMLTRITPAAVMQAMAAPAVAQAIGLSLATTTVTVLLVAIAGTPLASLLARSGLRGRRWLEVLIELPIVLPPSVAGIALLCTFGRTGWIGRGLEPLGLSLAFTPAAVIVAQVFVSAPFFIKSAAIGLSAVDRDMIDAAALDGASPAATFLHVKLPLAWRSFVSGAALCWARALGEFGATIIFAGNFPGRTQTMPLAIYIGFEMNLDQALALAAILLGLALLLLSVVQVTVGRATHLP